MKELINQMLIILFGSEEMADRWWESPNFYFGLKTPEEVLHTNEGLVHKYVLNQFDMQI